MDENTLPRRGSAVLWLALVLATWLIVECISFAAYGILNRTKFSYSRVVSGMTADVASGAGSTGLSGRNYLNWPNFVEVLHPYFGFVGDPDKNTPNWQVSDMGFVFNQGENDRPKRSPDRLVVAVFGGSFAAGTFPVLEALYQSREAELGKKVRFVNFASGGYKEPQQLMILNYMLALGAEFDVAINIDGFNDVVLPVYENLPSHVNPFFPRGWDRRTAETIAEADVRRVGLIEFMRGSRADWARCFLHRRLYLSPTLCLLWQFREQRMTRAIAEAEREVSKSGADSKSFTMHGPKYEWAGDDQLFGDLARVWRNSSEQMSVLCAARGIRYYHFLQPNQYVPDSKPMSADEKRTVAPDTSPYRSLVVRGYPHLLKAGQDLKASGVNFTDLTRIFENVHEPVYADDLCHLNHSGYETVSERIFDVIQEGVRP
jgi:hypothetical protein